MTFCASCGIEFIPDKEHPYQKFCCQQHRKKFGHKQERLIRTQKEREARGQKVCSICGSLWFSTRDHPYYCSDQCSDVAEKRGHKQWNKDNYIAALPKKRVCLYCGEEFEAIGKRKFCRDEHGYLYLYGRELPKEHTKQCEWCGSIFITRYQKARACPKHAKRLANWERKQRMLAVVHVPYSRWEIFQRDNFLCHICGAPIDMNAPAPLPYSPSIDHVIPIKHGGADASYNVMASHFICNSKKSDRLMQ
jgi:5-methylcytosine-specific restriction endonuclease McrA